MPHAGPYRPAWSSSWQEEEMWQRLDWALEEALRDPELAWSMAWSIAADSADLPDVRRCAVALMSELQRCESPDSLLTLEAAPGGLEE